MKQNTAYGASRMTSPISVIDTSNTASITRRKGAVFSASVSTMPMPNITAKNISARIEALLDAASMTLLGTIDSSMSMPRGVSSTLATICCVRPVFSAISESASTGSTPAPGRSQLVATSPISTATVDSATVQASVLQPIRPSERTSPISAMPATSAENSSGTISMKIRLRKIVENGVVT